jgi:hypothetical protein
MIDYFIQDISSSYFMSPAEAGSWTVAREQLSKLPLHSRLTTRASEKQ